MSSLTKVPATGRSPFIDSPTSAAADDDDGDPNRRRCGTDGRAAAERVAHRHVVVDESAGERTIAFDRQSDERRGGGDAELAACLGQRLISRHSDSSVRTST